jgi:hypothetical protein
MFGIDLLNLPSDEEYATWPSHGKFLLVDFIKLHVITSIKRYEPRIHRITLSGKTKKFNELKKHFSSFEIKSKSDEYFKYIIAAKINNDDITVGLFPREPRNFDFMLFYNFVSYRTLYILNRSIADLQLSKVEYTFDLVLFNNFRTRNLFNLLKRYVYIPKQSVTQIIGSPKSNLSYYIGGKIKKFDKLKNPLIKENRKLKGNFHFKIYERSGIEQIKRREDYPLMILIDSELNTRPIERL